MNYIDKIKFILEQDIDLCDGDTRIIEGIPVDGFQLDYELYIRWSVPKLQTFFKDEMGRKEEHHVSRIEDVDVEMFLFDDDGNDILTEEEKKDIRNHLKYFLKLQDS